jgi:hypothetical protein
MLLKVFAGSAAFKELVSSDTAFDENGSTTKRLARSPRTQRSDRERGIESEKRFSFVIFVCFVVVLIFGCGVAALWLIQVAAC